MPEVYRKIEKRIMDLKKKEELWKGRYRQIAQQVKELLDSSSREMKQMESEISSFDGRIRNMEALLKKNEGRMEEMFRLMDKRMTELSNFSKGVSERLEEKDGQIKKLKIDIDSHVSRMIAKHEKTFDSVLEKISLATRRIEGEFEKEESIYEKMEGAKRFLESHPPVPEPVKSDPPPNQAIPQFAQQPAPAPVPERLHMSGASFPYDPYASISPPQDFMRMPRAKPLRKHIDVDELDDDMDVDDVISGNMKGFKQSVESMSMGMSGIAEKLASIEESVAKMQAAKTPGVERLDDKVRMYTRSVADIHSRMETVEKALRDGMTPMMETMKLLTETVKDLKDSRPRASLLAKPTPPIRKKPSAKPLTIRNV